MTFTETYEERTTAPGGMPLMLKLFVLITVLLFLGAVYYEGRRDERKVWDVESETETHVIHCGCSEHRLTITAPCHISEITHYDRVVEEETDGE